jgi:hypothetical protein
MAQEVPMLGEEQALFALALSRRSTSWTASLWPLALGELPLFSPLAY